MHTAFIVDGPDYYAAETSSLINTLPVGVYKLMASPEKGFWLTKMGDSFNFDYKLYGVSEWLIERAEQAWNSTTGNMGMLFNGIQGVGKTVTAKLIANRVQLPVIILESNYGKAMVDYLAQFQQPLVIFCDEYEKTFKGQREDEYNNAEEDHTMLSLMDGVMKGDYRKLFLLTTNKERISEYMTQRPGRVRYKVTFGNLTRDNIEEIVDDKLVHKHLRDVTIKFLAQLELITVDIVTKVVEEVNIFEQDPEQFKDFFNIKKVRNRFDIIWVGGGTDGEDLPVKFSTELHAYDSEEESNNLWNALHTGRQILGTIQSVNGSNSYDLQLSNQGPDFFKKKKNGDLVTVRIEPVMSYNAIWADYAF